ncbi:MAG: hypothetical protein HYY82_19220 [Deltaproteobacteria bacterium]|nr:hypothetical protein [Deltaproteobacteria bacterium]
MVGHHQHAGAKVEQVPPREARAENACEQSYPKTAPSEPGIPGILDFLSDSIPEAKTALPSQFFDDRFVGQVNAGR